MPEGGRDTNCHAVGRDHEGNRSRKAEVVHFRRLSAATPEIAHRVKSEISPASILVTGSTSVCYFKYILRKKDGTNPNTASGNLSPVETLRALPSGWICLRYPVSLLNAQRVPFGHQ